MAKKRPDGEGDVCERRRWRMKRAIRSGSNTAIGKKRLAQTEPMLQQEETTNEQKKARWRWNYQKKI